MREEKIYSIPVHEAFESDCECPVCAMYDRLEKDALAYTMGPSYMEDDIRAMTDKAGFCQKHIAKLSVMGNKLGLALMLKTHFDKVISDVERMQGATVQQPMKKTLFGKSVKAGGDELAAYLGNLQSTCFVCDRIDTTFERYLDTIFYLWKNEQAFQERFAASRGFCNTHYAMLRDKAPDKLKAEECTRFIKLLDALYLDNMKRVRDDVAWFINKFDYKYADEPWKNAKDALPRAVLKSNSLLPEEDG